MSGRKKLTLKLGHQANEIGQLRALLEWYDRRPPWWKPWAVRKWKGEEPK